MSRKAKCEPKKINIKPCTVPRALRSHDSLDVKIDAAEKPRARLRVNQSTTEITTGFTVYVSLKRSRASRGGEKLVSQGFPARVSTMYSFRISKYLLKLPVAFQET